MNRKVVTPKYQSVADALESAIRDGEWNGEKMPSVRDVATRHHVSIVTASRAIQVIRDKGLIHIVERAGAFRMPAPAADKFAVLLRVTPSAIAGEVAASVRIGFELLARRIPMHLPNEVFQLSPGLTVEDATVAAQAALASGVHGVFLLPSRTSAAETEVEETFLDGCRAAGLPVVLLERNLRDREDLRHDLVALDDIAAAKAVTRHLIGLGRKRIGMAVASPTSSHRNRLTGYLFALQDARRNPGDYPDHVLNMPEEYPTPRAGEYLLNEIKARNLDAIICYHDYIALGVMVELLRHGHRVPEDVAIVGFENLPAASLTAPGLTTCEYPAEQLAEQAVRLMNDRRKVPDRPPVKVVVPSRLIVRGTTDPTVAL
ncbi:LacI family DNA-binding transcriptional regulator [Limnoglobus roseus]|uniref:Transcriptional regulator, GntR family protein n=1 Tax=Limnoglobus roseus TaxID=2598579 RepID=A0A5C1A864_9BACT|nr:GntR family transcriptional regulator [Limnoglobus roseus]QEL15401.1 transcriptional regulator, GntR family protein [Limnoglobus roseus]